MPYLQVSMRAGKPAAYRLAIIDSLYQAMRDALSVPEDDQFITITEHEAANFRYGASYMGISRSDDLLYIQAITFDTRTLEQKKAFYQRAAQLLGESPGIRKEDVFITILPNAKQNWSLGNGVTQFA